MAEDIYKKIAFYSKDLVDNKLVAASGGNISARCNKKIYISSSGSSLSDLGKNDIILINPSSKNPKSFKKASCEYRLHLACYKIRKDIGCVVHTHPIYATVLGLTSRKKLPVSYEVVSIMGSGIKTIEYLDSGTNKLALRVGREIKDVNALVLAGHGLVVVGSGIQEAVDRSICLEREAKRWILEKIILKLGLVDKKIFNSIKHFIEV